MRVGSSRSFSGAMAVARKLIRLFLSCGRRTDTYMLRARPPASSVSRMDLDTASMLSRHGVSRTEGARDASRTCESRVVNTTYGVISDVLVRCSHARCAMSPHEGERI